MEVSNEPAGSTSLLKLQMLLGIAGIYK